MGVLARVFLINPPSPEPVKTPLLALCYLASSLRRAGHEVALCEASAPASPDVDTLLEQVAAFAPDLVGVHIKTLHVQPAYALARRLADAGHRLVAGGPHPTVCWEEPLAHGFEFVLRGEAEESLVELCDALDGRGNLSAIAGLCYRERGMIRINPGRDFLRDLDGLADPLAALDLFDPAWYGTTSAVAPAGLLSSRGCPAACTFCSNNVTGRRFRYRSAAGVADEARALATRGQTAFSFFDDSFAVGHRRVRELAEALAPVRIAWTCTAHPGHLDLPTLRDMKRAGCCGVDIGMESGDPGMLLRIGKGVTVERVLEVLAWCREVGLHTVLNLMFGWPDETAAELQATLDFMERAAPLAGGFNARGVLVPYPGTEIYDRYHERFGFTSWWLREAPLAYQRFPAEWSLEEVTRCYAEDAALERNFFQHPPAQLALIKEALLRKTELSFASVIALAHRGRLKNQVVPAAGAR